MKKQTVQILANDSLIDNLKKLFNPARGQDETQKAYKIRRANAHTYHKLNVVKAKLTRGGGQSSRESMRSNSEFMSKNAGQFGRYLRDFIQAKNLTKIRYGS